MSTQNENESISNSINTAGSSSQASVSTASDGLSNHHLRNYGIALLVVTAILVFIFWFFQYTGRPLMRLGGINTVLSGKYSVKDVGPKAFGDLNVGALTAAPETMAQTDAGSKVADQKMMATGLGGGGGMIPYPGNYNYHFKYVGGELPTLGDLQEVYRLDQPKQSEGFVNTLVRAISAGLIDLQKMRSAKVDYITFSEERPMGYTFNLDMSMGFVNISQNWKFWPNIPTVCDQNYCGPMPRLKQEDMLSEEQAITIADKFIQDYSISREGLGKPFMDQGGGVGIYQPAEARPTFIPDQISVVYPKVIDGLTVYNENGTPEGLQVSIDVRQKAVIGAYGITKNQYQRSLYTGELDRAKLIGVAEKGGFRNYNYEDPNAKTVTLEVGSPSVAIISMWYSQPNSNYSEQIYTKSLLFPIKDAKKYNYWRDYLIVPLVKEILDSDNQNPPIMPYVKEGAPGSSSPEVVPTPSVQIMPVQ